MNKPYLLIAGENFYPSRDTGDWIGCFSTYEEAKAQVTSMNMDYEHHTHTQRITFEVLTNF